VLPVPGAPLFVAPPLPPTAFTLDPLKVVLPPTPPFPLLQAEQD